MVVVVVHCHTEYLMSACFRVMVLQNGEIMEFDSPTNLLADSSSQFYSMARDAGLVWHFVLSLYSVEPVSIASFLWIAYAISTMWYWLRFRLCDDDCRLMVGVPATKFTWRSFLSTLLTVIHGFCLFCLCLIDKINRVYFKRDTLSIFCNKLSLPLS